jgi:RNA polymerase sigma factor (TIGR02999 family)
MSDVTQILEQAEAGEPQSREALFKAVYQELRQMAAAQMSCEQPGQTLQPTALVHEVWLRLMRAPSPESFLRGGDVKTGRRYFFAAAAEAMRRILIEKARRKQAEKRGGLQQRIDLDSALLAVEAPEQHEELHEALKALARLDTRKAELVRLRYFLGLSLPEIAEVLAISQATAERDWAFARAWLYSQLESSSRKPPF